MLEVQRIVKRFDADATRRLKLRNVDVDVRRPALAGVDVVVEEGQFHTLLGPSGCGKTTLLRSVAGLEQPDEGEIRLDGDTLFSSATGTNVPTDRRGLGMVFQSYAIWPHMTVRQNVAFPLTVGKGKRPKSEVEPAVLAALEAVGLSEVVDRSSTKLSGGQQQRLAFARALVGHPRLLLLDEPLSNLDAQLRASMRLELKRLQRELGITTLYVTHDQSEALAMSDVITVMNHGTIMQQGSPREIYDEPANLFVARFVGSPNVLDAKIDEGSGRSVVLTDLGPLRCPVVPDDVPEVAVVLRPEDLVPQLKATGEGNELSGVVAEQSFEGEYIRQIVDVAGVRLECRTGRHSELRPGDEVTIPLPAEHVRVVRA